LLSYYKWPDWRQPRTKPDGNPVLINKFFALYSLALLRKEVRLALLTPNQTKGVLARH